MNTAADPLAAPPASPWRWWVCILLMLATVVNYMDRLALNQMALRIKTYFSLDDADYGLLEGMFSLGFGIGAIASGYIVDRLGVRWVYPATAFLWSAAGILTGFANGFWMLLSCRFALGFFEAGNWPCALRTTRMVLRPDERSLGNSLFGSGTALGAVITPLIVLALLRSVDPFEPERHAIMSVTGGTYAAVTNAPTDAWKYPFRVIGSLGVVWVALWFLTVPRSMLRETPKSTSDAGHANFLDIFRDRRFWVLFTITISVNIVWHGYRTWLPLYLQKQRGFNEAEMSRFMTVYYLTADVGSWTIGGLTLLVCRRGMSIHRARVIALGFCATLVLTTFAIPFLPDGWPFYAGVLVVAFGAMGLFPTYFALSQELSGTHQGKVSGTLGLCAHGSLAMLYPIEGLINKATNSYEIVLGGIGLAPMIAFLLLLTKWKHPGEPIPEEPPATASQA